jgi:O-methyltransferase
MSDLLLSTEEAEHLERLARESSKLGGDFIEVGVYKGKSAEILCKVKGDKALHLYDTWDGIVSTTEEDKPVNNGFYEGRYRAEFAPVQELLQPYKNVHFYKGEFPKSYTDNISSVAFLHLDVDLFHPTRKALEIFWDKLVVGGNVVLHDYPGFEGVRLAVDGFLKDKQFIKKALTREQSVITKL